MVNQILLNEIKKNEKGHKIFDYQKNEDLIELDEYIKIIPHEIVISLTQKEWYYPSLIIYSEEDTLKQIQACRKYLVAKIVRELQKEYKELEKYEIDNQLNIFNKKAKKEYFTKKNQMLNVKELLDMIRIEEIPIERIHIIIDTKYSEIICDALTILLENNLPFSTSVYLTYSSFYTILVPDKKDTFLWQAYHYKRFTDQEKENKILRKK